MTVALLRLAFTVASVFSTLTCHYLQVAGSFFNRYEVRRLVVLPLLVSLSFHVLFHSPSGVLFTFPSRYCCAIGHTGVLSLTRWSSQIHTEFHVLRATRDTARSTHLSITGLSPSVARHSNVSSRIVGPYCCPTTPIVKTIGLGYSPFARRY